MRGQSEKSHVRQPGTFHIGIDLMGSDVAPRELLEAILAFRSQLDPSVHLLLLGTEELFIQTYPPDGVLFHPVLEVITMEEDPLHAIRHKKQSSLCLGVRLLKEGHLDAFISAGNTGALMGAAKLSLSTLPGVDRPALLTLLPTRKSEIAVLDVGANTSSKAAHLIQFALMGVAFQKSRSIESPRVALLNIGSEAGKGTPELRSAYEKLQQMHGGFEFLGNIEARDVFQGGVDVLVTDGFTGNVFLKTAEGIAAVILEEFELAAHHFDKSALKELRHHLHYAEYPGAILCGVNGIIIKCHGSAATHSILRSITSAHRLIEHGFLTNVSRLLSLENIGC